MKKENIKLFKMNDYDYVAAETKEQAQEWYLKNCGIDEEENPFDEIMEVSDDTSFLIDINEADEDELQQGFPIKIIESTNNQELILVKVPFKYDLSKMPDEIDEPWIVASTEQ